MENLIMSIGRIFDRNIHYLGPELAKGMFAAIVEEIKKELQTNADPINSSTTNS